MNNRISKTLRDLCRTSAAMAAFLSTMPAAQAQQQPRSGAPVEVTYTGRVITAPADVAAPPSDATLMPSGLAMKILRPGGGTQHPGINDCVTVSFIAWKTDGTLFSTSTTMNDADVLCLNAAIIGISEALQTMVAGEERRLWIPEDLTFHEGHHHLQRRPEDEEPPHKDLTFDLKLLSILKAPPTPEDIKEPPATASKTASGLAYLVLQKGNGTSHPTANSKVIAHFSAWRIDGRLFETTVMGKQPALINVAMMPMGVREALSMMVTGEKARFWLPAAIAYGEKPANRFNPPGDMVYEIELVDVQ